MTLRRTLVLRINLLIILIILAMSVTYYYLFTKDIRERSYQNVSMAFNLIFDDLHKEVENVSSNIDRFVQTSLVNPMSVIQMVQNQQEALSQDLFVWYVKKIMTYLNSVASGMNEFGTLLNATEILLYDKEQTLLAVYQQKNHKKITGVYLPKINEKSFVLIQPDDMWYATLQTIDEIPFQPIPADIPTKYADPLPDAPSTLFSTLTGAVTLQFIVPILNNGEKDGVCVIHIGITRENVVRYSQLSQTSVNFFAGTQFSIGTLPEYAEISGESLKTYQQIQWQNSATLPPIAFTDIAINNQSYYQGTLAIGDNSRAVGAITTLFPRALEEKQKRNFFIVVAGIAILFSVLSGGEAFRLSAAIARPITNMIHVIRKLTQGDLAAVIHDAAAPSKKGSRWIFQHSRASEQPTRYSMQELAELAQALQAMVEYLQEAATAAEHIALGEIEQDIRPRSEQDVLGRAFHHMTLYLHEMATVATALAKGDLRHDMHAKTERDVLGNAFEQMIAYLEEAADIAQKISVGDIQVRVTPKSSRDVFNEAFAETIRYVQEIANIAQKVAIGNVIEVAVMPRSERDILNHSFAKTIEYIREVADVAQKLAVGDIHVDVTPKSNRDVLNYAFAHTIKYVQEVTDLAEKISNKQLNVKAFPKSSQDVLNHSLQRMVTNLQIMMDDIHTAMIAVEKQNWLKTGQAELSDAMRGEQPIAGLAQNIVTYLATYLQAQVGTIYLADEHTATLRLYGAHAFTKPAGYREEIPIGQGMVGQSALEKQLILFSNIPDDYLRIQSSLGETTPRHILMLPFSYDHALKGVIELGKVSEFSELQQNFLREVSENIAIAIHTTQTRAKVMELLEKTQVQSEELQQQQEELRKMNEELETQTRILKASEERLRIEQGKLQEINRELAEKNVEVENARQLIEEKAKALELSNKYKSEFLANMSHELRTPLNSLLLLSRFLYENKEKNLTEKQVEFARTINTSGTELLSLINEILDLAKVEAGKMALNVESMELSQLPAYIQRHFAHVAQERGLYLKIDVDRTLPEFIRTDAQRVEQILKNFLSNALKFTHRGGITVRISRPAPQTDLSHSQLDPRRTIAIAVADTGIGIPNDKLRSIFNAFQQVDGSTTRKYGGTGLGLSISRELTLLLRGEIHVASEEQQGSVFTLFLPEILDDPKPTEPLDVSAPPMDTKRPESAAQSDMRSMISSTPIPPVPDHVKVDTIRDDRHDIAPADHVVLIIEDDAAFAKILRDRAREHCFKCLIAGDGEAGLQLVYQYMPNAIILDVGLPGMNGWKVMERLKENLETRHIPVHFISAQDTHNDAMKMGAIGYLTKPVSVEELDLTFKKIEEIISDTLKKILVLEKDTFIRTNLLTSINRNDIDVKTAEEAEEAYALLTAEHFDCLIIDLSLMDRAGTDLLDRIKTDRQLSPIPIIAYTGEGISNEKELLLTQYSESIIIKGVKSQERLLDEVTLFLHQVEKDLPEMQRQQLRGLHHKEVIMQGKTVLLVDDDVRNVFALTQVLEEQGLHVLMGTNGKEAVELVEHHPEINLVLMDVMMPEMDGYDAMKAIRTQPQFEKLPIIALTAKAMKGDRQKCLEAGANEYLSKPIDTDKLFSLLQVWLY